MNRIDDSLARGMAHAFLDHVAETDRVWTARRQAYRGRAQLPRPDNLKSFHTAVQHMRTWTPERYRICEWSARSGKKAVWCDARLTRSGHEDRDSLSVQMHEVTSTGRAGTLGTRVTVTLHALQRMIQRSGLIRPPFDARALDPLYAEFNSLPVRLTPVFYAGKTLDTDERAGRSLLIQADQAAGVCTDTGSNCLVVKAYLGEGEDMLTELVRALEKLHGFDECDLAPFQVRTLPSERQKVCGVKQGCYVT